MPIGKQAGMPPGCLAACAMAACAAAPIACSCAGCGNIIGGMGSMQPPLLLPIGGNMPGRKGKPNIGPIGNVGGIGS